MNLHHLPVAAAVLVAALSPGAWAQGNAQPAAPAAAASAAKETKPGPRVVTNSEQREASATPGALRPDPKVAPQVSIPLVNTPTGVAKKPFTGRSGTAAPAGGIDDSAARCEAESTAQLREQCRSKQGRPPQR
jgi:hypothetical protein